MSGILGTRKVTQIGFVVEDIEATKKKFAAFLGVDVPPHFDGGRYEVTGTTVEGEPAPEANCLMAFFDIGEGIQLELIQPNEVRSAWRDYLNEHGEGFHHIAFHVEAMDPAVKRCEDWGMTELQRGKYGSGDGEYVYMDARADLKCLIELLENY